MTNISFYTPKDDMAGLFGVGFETKKKHYTFHFLMKKQFSVFGTYVVYSDGFIHLFGMLRLFAIAYILKDER